MKFIRQRDLERFVRTAPHDKIIEASDILRQIVRVREDIESSRGLLQALVEVFDLIDLENPAGKRDGARYLRGYHPARRGRGELTRETNDGQRNSPQLSPDKYQTARARVKPAIDAYVRGHHLKPGEKLTTKDLWNDPRIKKLKEEGLVRNEHSLGMFIYYMSHLPDVRIKRIDSGIYQVLDYRQSSGRRYRRASGSLDAELVRATFRKQLDAQGGYTSPRHIAREIGYKGKLYAVSQISRRIAEEEKGVKSERVYLGVNQEATTLYFKGKTRPKITLKERMEDFAEGKKAIKHKDIKRVFELKSDTYIIGFYTRLGFEQTGSLPNLVYRKK